MSSLFIGETPLLTDNLAEVGTVIDLGLVEGEGLADRSLTEAIAVTQLQVDGVSTCLGVLITHFLQCGICIAVQDPHGVCTSLRSICGNHLVGLLVNADVEVNTAYRRNTIGVCAVKAFGRAGCHQHTCHQHTHCIFKQILHNRCYFSFQLFNSSIFQLLIVVLLQRRISIKLALRQRDMLLARTPTVGAVAVSIGNENG